MTTQYVCNRNDGKCVCHDGSTTKTTTTADYQQRRNGREHVDVVAASGTTATAVRRRRRRLHILDERVEEQVGILTKGG